MNLAEKFKAIAGREITDAEAITFNKVQSALGIKENDALFSLLFALQLHQANYEKIPELIAEAGKQSVAASKLKVDGVIAEAVRVASESLGATVAAEVDKISGMKAKSERKRVHFIGAGIFAAVFLVVFITGFWSGRALGLKDGINVNLAASWAATPEGLKAFKLYQNGAMDLFTTCTGAGWVSQNGNCYATPPKNVHDDLQGWKLP